MSESTLTSLSDIYRFFRKNKLPIYFISPTAYNILGLGRWIQSLKYVTYFDSFDGLHHRIVNPKSETAPEFNSMEEIVNFLLGHKETYDLVASQGGRGKLLTVMFDEKTEELAEKIGLEIALPSAALRKHLDSKIVTTQLGNEAGVASVPNTLCQVNSYAELKTVCEQHRLGDHLVVQTPYGDSGKTTFFIASESDWNKHQSEIVGEDIKVMKYIRHIPYTVEAVATRCGTLVGPVQTDITGFPELTPYRGGWCGNDIFHNVLTADQHRQVLRMVKAMGDRLYQEGYKGTFCFDFLIDSDDGQAYMGEINPRISGASPLTNLVTSKFGGAPLMMFHMLEFMDVDFDIDIDRIQERWSDFDNWSQLVMKYPEDRISRITRAPQTGTWELQEDGSAQFINPSIGWGDITDESEAFYLRVHGEGEYLYKGADLGILISPGRMQTDERELTDRAQQWIAAMHNQFESEPLPAPQESTIPEMGVRKML